MNKLSKQLIRTTLAAVVLCTSVLVASPANAISSPPSLPNGWTMYSLDCDSHGGQLSSVNVATGETTPIGDPTALGNDSECAAQGTYLSATNSSYVKNDAAAGGKLAQVNVDSGKITNIAPTDAYALTSDAAGTVYSSIWSLTNPQEFGLVTVNLTTGATSFVDTTNTYRAPYNLAIAVNPVDDKIYMFTRDTASNSPLRIVTVNKATGELVETNKVVDESASGLNRQASPGSMAIDSNGIAWIEDDNYGAIGGLIAVNLATGEAWNMSDKFFNATLYPSSSYYYTMSIWLVPPAGGGNGENGGNASRESGSLANTGFGGAPFLASGVLISLVGGALLLRARRQKNS